MQTETLKNLARELETCQEFLFDHEDDLEGLYFLRQHCEEFYLCVENLLDACWPESKKPALYCIQSAINNLIQSIDDTLTLKHGMGCD